MSQRWPAKSVLRQRLPKKALLACREGATPEPEGGELSFSPFILLCTDSFGDLGGLNRV